MTTTLKHIFFDLDGTLTRSHARIDESNIATLVALCNAKDVVIVTGGTYEDIRKQLTSALDDKYYSLAQSGGHGVDRSGDVLWREEITPTQTEPILDLIEKMKEGFNIKVRDENDCVELRGSQVSYSVLGYNEDIEKKYAFDPDFSRRKRMLSNFPSQIEHLRTLGIEVAVGGTTTFNFTRIGQDKGSNVARLINREGWDKADCIYVGDALAPGENDYAVVGVIETKSVKNPDETFSYIKEMLS